MSASKELLRCTLTRLKTTYARILLHDLVVMRLSPHLADNFFLPFSLKCKSIALKAAELLNVSHGLVRCFLRKSSVYDQFMPLNQEDQDGEMQPPAIIIQP